MSICFLSSLLFIFAAETIQSTFADRGNVIICRILVAFPYIFYNVNLVLWTSISSYRLVCLSYLLYSPYDCCHYAMYVLYPSIAISFFYRPKTIARTHTKLGHHIFIQFILAITSMYNVYSFINSILPPSCIYLHRGGPFSNLQAYT